MSAQERACAKVEEAIGKLQRGLLPLSGKKKPDLTLLQFAAQEAVQLMQAAMAEVKGEAGASGDEEDEAAVLAALHQVLARRKVATARQVRETLTKPMPIGRFDRAAIRLSDQQRILLFPARKPLEASAADFAAFIRDSGGDMYNDMQLGPNAATPPASAVNEEAVLATLRQLDARHRYDGIIPLRAVRPALKEYKRKQLDAALLDMERRRLFDIQIANDPRAVPEPEAGIQVDGRGLLYYLVLHDPPKKAAAMSAEQFETAFDEAFKRLNWAGGSINQASLVDLRKALPVDREFFDAQLKALRKKRKYSLSPYEGRFLLFVSRRP